MDVNKLRGRQFKSQQELNQALVELFAEDRAEYIRQYNSFSDTHTHKGRLKKFPLDDKNNWALITDCIQEAGSYGDYFFQDIWGARRIYESGAKHAYDIGSRVDGFIAHLLAMNIQVTLLDIRPMNHRIDGVSFIQADAMKLDNIPDDSIQTLSSLCALEHFGLGRYSDPVDYNGWSKALHAIKRKIKVGGWFYLSVPVGHEDKLIFNAHRIFRPTTIIDELAPELELQEFSYIAGYKINTCFTDGFDGDVMEFVSDNRLKFEGKGGFTGLFAFKKKKLAIDV